MARFWTLAVSAASLSGIALAQRTEGQSGPCNPLKDGIGVCNPNLGLATSEYFIDFTRKNSLPRKWTISNNVEVLYGAYGAEFSFKKRYDAPQLWTDFYIFFGSVETVMRVAPGTGIISSSVLISDDLDEIDWEFSGNNFGNVDSTGMGQNNYFGKGIAGNYDRGQTFDVFNAQGQFHTYRVDWTPEQIVWSVDGTPVRTLLAKNADQDTHQFPQSPCKVQLGLWDGGDPDVNAGTRDWAGGLTTFPEIFDNVVTFYVKSVKITNANPAYGYNYTDTTGEWESIQLLKTPPNADGTWTTSSSSSNSTGKPTSSTSSSSSTVRPTTSVSSTMSVSSLTSSTSGSSSTATSTTSTSSTMSVSSLTSSTSGSSSTATSTTSTSSSTSVSSPTTPTSSSIKIVEPTSSASPLSSTSTSRSTSSSSSSSKPISTIDSTTRITSNRTTTSTSPSTSTTSTTKQSPASTSSTTPSPTTRASTTKPSKSTKHKLCTSTSTKASSVPTKRPKHKRPNRPPPNYSSGGRPMHWRNWQGRWAGHW